MDEQPITTQSPWLRIAHSLIAAILSVVQTGLGQVYLGAASRSLPAVAGLYILMIVCGLAGWLSTIEGYSTLFVVALGLQIGFLIDAAVVGWRRGREARFYNRWFTFPLSAVLLVGTYYGLLSVHRTVLGFEISRIPAASMEPTLMKEDYILIDTRVGEGGRAPRRGDVVVFRAPMEPSTNYVKRIVAVGGDEVEGSTAGVSVNGHRVEESYLRNGSLPFPKTLVPDGELFVLGDNRDRSADSRIWGPVKLQTVRGKVTWVVYSAQRISFGIPVTNPWPDHAESFN